MSIYWNHTYLIHRQGILTKIVHSKGASGEMVCELVINFALGEHFINLKIALRVLHWHFGTLGTLAYNFANIRIAKEINFAILRIFAQINFDISKKSCTFASEIISKSVRNMTLGVRSRIDLFFSTWKFETPCNPSHWH